MSGKMRERKQTKVSVNNGQLCMQPPPRVANASRLDQFLMIQYSSKLILINLSCFIVIYIIMNLFSQLVVFVFIFPMQL